MKSDDIKTIAYLTAGGIVVYITWPVLSKALLAIGKTADIASKVGGWIIDHSPTSIYGNTEAIAKAHTLPGAHPLGTWGTIKQSIIDSDYTLNPAALLHQGNYPGQLPGSYSRGSWASFKSLFGL